MLKLQKIKKYGLLTVFFLVSIAGNAANMMNFLPLEDSYYSSRNSEYSSSIERIKPYRESIHFEQHKMKPDFSFGTVDLMLLFSLFGIYLYFTQKKTNSRTAGF